MNTIDESPECGYPNFENFQPSHAEEIARHFRKIEKPPWSDETKGQIIEWVDKCEAEALTVPQFGMRLRRARGKTSQG